MKVKPEWLVRFRHEAANHIEQARVLLDWLDNNPDLAEEERARQLRQLFIKAHSVKGTASMIGLEQISAQAEKLETLWGEAWLAPGQYNAAQQAGARQKLDDLAALVAQVGPEQPA